jgi:hypothetical protein
MYTRGEARAGQHDDPKVSDMSVSVAGARENPIVSPMDRVKWPRMTHDNPGFGILGAIYRHQNPEDCNSAKYLVWRLPTSKKDARNIGALYSTIQVWLAYAYMTGRILVIDGTNWKLTDSRCEKRSPECYFRPVSACAPPINPTSKKYFKNSKKLHEEHTKKDIQVIEFEGAWWPMIATHPFQVSVPREDGTWEQIEAVCKPKAATDWAVAAMQYMWRPTTDSEILISDVLGKLQPSLKVDPERTIAMPVRASDKCHGHKIEKSAHGEEVSCR